MDFKSWIQFDAIDENTSLEDWITLFESNSRYSIEANYRSEIKEVLIAFAKIALGYVSAVIKKDGHHVKHVFDSKPVRIIISKRNWDDGEWNLVVTFNPEHSCFMISKGFYNKNRNTVSVQSTKKCAGDSAAEVAKEVRNAMHKMKNDPDRHQEKLKSVPLKRGPKR